MKKNASFDTWALFFRKAWMGGQESAFKKDKKRALGTEGNTTFFLCYQPNGHKGFTFT